MKIALVSDWYLPRIGGIESYLQDLSRELLARGHRVHVITSTPPSSVKPSTRVPVPHENVPDGVTVHRLDLPRLPGWDVVGSPRVLEQLASIGRRERFDVVHGVSIYSPLAHAAMRIARESRVAAMMSSHSLLGPGGVLALSLAHDLLGWGRWPHVLTGVSSVAAEETRLAAHRDRVHVLANGIDLETWRPAEECRVHRPPTVVSVMRLCRRKRPLDLVEAIPRVNRLLPVGARPQFVIAGDGPLRGRIEHLATQLGVRDQLLLLGNRPRSEVRSILSHADLFALPTVKEAFGISILEAQAVGLPVVAMGGCGVADLVEHDENGLLAQSGEEFAAFVARVIADGELRTRLAARARARLETFSWARILERHLDLYALAQRRAAGELDAVREAA